MLDPLLYALDWIQQSMLGRTGVLLAVISFAAIGIRMLAGSVDGRQALSVIIGCFIIFGAVGIGVGISDDSMPAADHAIDDVSTLSIPTKHAAPAFDPYAGAAALVRPISKDQYRESARAR